jgi:hypothetical protein
LNLQGRFGLFVSALKFRFPATETSVRRDRFECDVGEATAPTALSPRQNILTVFRCDPQKHIASQAMMAYEASPRRPRLFSARFAAPHACVTRRSLVQKLLWRSLGSHSVDGASLPHMYRGERRRYPIYDKVPHGVERRHLSE